MLGTKTEMRRKVYLNIKNGAIVRRNADNQEEYFEYVEGAVERIYQWERTFRNEKVMYWYIDLRDEEGELYSLGFPYGSNTFKSIILNLASATDFSRVMIRPYRANDRDKVVVCANGVKLDWVTKQLPPVAEVMFNGRRVKDDTERMKFITALVAEIGKHLGKSYSKPLIQ